VSASTVVGPARPSVTAATRAPGLLGLMRGEFRKIWHHPLPWLLLLVALVLVGSFALAMGIGNGPGHEQLVSGRPEVAFAGIVDTTGFALQLALGIVFLPVSAWLVSMEYTNGTVHTLLGRGVGRVQLYVAKLCTLTLVGLLCLVAFTLALAAYAVVVVDVGTGGLQRLQTLPDWSWHNAAVVFGVQAVSLVTTILLGAVAGVVGRSSLAFAVTAAMTFFPADNFGLFVLRLVGRAVRSDWLQRLPDFFLGPNLNHLRNGLEVNHTPVIVFQESFNQDVTGLRSLLVVAAWCALFLVVPLVLLPVRDVRE
jgi:ABC-type transport system involved in multi-copper enzyme maturation permease subunit